MSYPSDAGVYEKPILRHFLSWSNPISGERIGEVELTQLPPDEGRFAFPYIATTAKKVTIPKGIVLNWESREL